jgi:voltage-gated potassium channel
MNVNNRNPDRVIPGKADRRASPLSKALDVAVIVGALTTIPLTMLEEHGAAQPMLAVFEWLVWGIFTLEFAVGVTSQPRKNLLRAGTAGKLAVVLLSFPPLPNFLALVSLARLTRIARTLRLLRLTGVAARAVGALKEILGRRGLVNVVAITTLLVLAGGACLSILEPETVKGGYGDGVWWAVVTLTTIGYGDISPATVWGRVIAVILMLAGMGLMSTLAASVTTYFVQQNVSAESKELSERLDRIERILRDSLPEGGSQRYNADGRSPVSDSAEERAHVQTV